MREWHRGIRTFFPSIVIAQSARRPRRLLLPLALDRQQRPRRVGRELGRVDASQQLHPRRERRDLERRGLTAEPGELLVDKPYDELVGNELRPWQVQARGVALEDFLAASAEADAALREAVEQQDKTRFDRSHFKEYGDSALAFESVYYVLGPDYNEYMDIQQAINLYVHEQFEKEGIEFAYPTQTLFINQ